MLAHSGRRDAAAGADRSAACPGARTGTLAYMFHGSTFVGLCLACLAGIFFGVLLADGTFINFRGEEVRAAIERLSDDDDRDEGTGRD